MIMRNRVIKVLLMIMITISILPILSRTTYAADWGGDGTEDSPWLIGSPHPGYVRAWLTTENNSKTLHISGDGNMQDFQGETPWYGSANSITGIVIGDKITNIGHDAFLDCTALKEIVIPSSVTSIGNSVFMNCNNLTTVTFKPGAENQTLTIGNVAFDEFKTTAIDYIDACTMKLYNGETAFEAGDLSVNLNGKTLVWKTYFYPLWVNNIQVTRDNMNDVLGAADTGATVSYTPKNGETAATLTLNGANITTGKSDTKAGIYYSGSDALNIILAENTANTITGNNIEYGVFSTNSSAKLTVSGKGQLNVTTEYSSFNAGIDVAGDLQIEESTVTSDASGANSSGIYSGNNITIKSGTVTSSAYGYACYGINSAKNLTIEGGIVVSSGNNHGVTYVSTYGVKVGGAQSVTISSGAELTAVGDVAAISGKVKNAVLGKGWDNVEHTGDHTPINISSEGQTLGFKYVEFKKHLHSFTYSASGNTITATCSELNCNLPNNTATLTISAPLHTTFDDGKDPNAVITDDNCIQGDAKVMYQEKSGDTYGEATETAPEEAGDYKACITLGTGEGAKTAYAEYTILQPANSVIDLINLLPEPQDVTVEHKDTIESARTAYEALTDAQKGEIPDETLKKLIDDEEVLETKTGVVCAPVGGSTSTWTKGSSSDQRIVFERNVNDYKTFSLFYQLNVDGKKLTKDEDYTAAAGSVEITLKASYLQTLSVGEHTLTAMFDDVRAPAVDVTLVINRPAPADPDYRIPVTGIE